MEAGGVIVPRQTVERVELLAGVEPVSRGIGVVRVVGLYGDARRVVVERLKRHALSADDDACRTETVAHVVCPRLHAVGGDIHVPRLVIDPPSAVVNLDERPEETLGGGVVVDSLDGVAVGFGNQCDVLRAGLRHRLRPVGAVAPQHIVAVGEVYPLGQVHIGLVGDRSYLPRGVGCEVTVRVVGEAGVVVGNELGYFSHMIIVGHVIDDPVAVTIYLKFNNYHISFLALLFF